MSKLSAPHFHNEEAAITHLESIIWPNGAHCPHCGGVERIGRLKGKSVRPGLWKCYQCRKQFTVKVGTVFESSHVPLTKWLQAAYLMATSKKGISAHQLHRILDVQYNTAWFMAHRLREAMKPLNLSPLGGDGETVEADETFIGRKKGYKVKNMGYHHKHKVLSLVQRGGKARSFHVADLYDRTLKPILVDNIKAQTTLMTDEFSTYKPIGKEFAKHEAVKHKNDEYVRGNAHTNTIEGFFSIFKRGMKGVYQHCSEQHLQRYLSEFDFRYSNRQALGIDDTSRTDGILQGIKGKRLTYRVSYETR